MTRGEIWWAYLRKPIGSEPGYKRPVVIIQADSFTQSGINTVICVALTSNFALAEIGYNILLKKSESGLPKDSVINVSQIVTLDKEYLDECAGSIAARSLEKLNTSLKIVLGVLP